MAEAGTKIQVVNALLLLCVLVSTSMMTCSNDRLEQRVIKLQKAVEQGGGGSAAAAASAPMTTSADARTPGAKSPVTAVGWGGRSAAVTYVEGAVPNAPLRLADKPLPQGDWMVERRTGAPKSLNYYTSNEGECSQVIRMVLGVLFWIDPENPPAVQPQLATSWETSADKLSYTFHLRKGVQFADGRPFTSADVKFSYDVLRDPEVGAAHLAANFEDVDEVTTPDPYTVVFKFKRLYWKAVYSAGFVLRVLDKGWYEEQIPIYAKKAGVEKYSIEPGKPGFGEVFRKIRVPSPGTGPYFVDGDDDYTQERIIMRQNPFYFGIQAMPRWWNIAQFRRIFVKDDVAADEMFRKQEVDVAVVSDERWETQLKDDPVVSQIANHFLYDHTGLDCNYVCWNCRKPPFDDARVRTAMTCLLDREWIFKTIYRSHGSIAVCRSKRSYPTYSNELVAHPFDIEKAKKLLAEAGWKDTDGDGVLDKDGVRFEFTAKASSGGGADTQRILGVMQDACKKAGIRMDYELSEWSTFIKDFEERRFSAAFLGSSWGDPWIDLYEEFHSSQDVPQGGNSAGWHNATADALLEKMRVEFDDDKRTEMFHAFNRIFYDEQPQTLIIHPQVSVLLNKRFQDWKIRKTGLQNFDLWVKPEDRLHK